MQSEWETGGGRGVGCKVTIDWETGREAGISGDGVWEIARLGERLWCKDVVEAGRMGGWEGGWMPGRLEIGRLEDSEAERETGRQRAPPCGVSSRRAPLCVLNLAVWPDAGTHGFDLW